MEYMRLSSKLTSEEKMLQAKYAVLKKKKRALQSLKVSQPEQERTPAPKSPVDSKTATMAAKIMVQMGILPAFTKKANQSEQSGFKRSTTLKRRLCATKPAVEHGQSASGDYQTLPDVLQTEPKLKRKNVYKPSLSVHDWEEEPVTTKQPTRELDQICKGNPSLVKGRNISEDYLKKSFEPCGTIVNIAKGVKRHCGFVTFDEVEAANRAVTESNGCMASGLKLKVSFAQEEPKSWPSSSTSSPELSNINADDFQDTNREDNRDLLVYENNLFE